MSQNDYVIANQTTPLFRADLNLALQALASNSSGSSAPSTTYANMLWYDTANNTLKMRSEADDAWITLGTLDQALNTFTPAGVTGISTDPDLAGVDPTLLTNRATIATAIAEGVAGAPQLHKVPLVISQAVISGSVATVDFFFDSALYDDIIVSMGNLRTVDFGAVRVRLSDNGTTFASGASDYKINKQLDGTFSNISASYVSIAESVGSASGEDGLSGLLHLFQPSLARFTGGDFQASFTNTSGTYRATSGSFIRTSSISTEGIQFISNGANFTGGTITLYGVLK